jgi:hypothetical protein
VRIDQLTEYETRQLQASPRKVRRDHLKALEEAGRRRSQSTQDLGNGLLIDDLFGPEDGPYKPWPVSGVA